MLQQLAQAGLIKGKTIGVDSTTLEANAAMKSIVRRDTREGDPCLRTRVSPPYQSKAHDSVAAVGTGVVQPLGAAPAGTARR